METSVIDASVAEKINVPDPGRWMEPDYKLFIGGE